MGPYIVFFKERCMEGQKARLFPWLCVSRVTPILLKSPGTVA